VDYFDAVYEIGTHSCLTAADSVVVLPLFLPEKWNMHQATMNNGYRNNSLSET